MGKHLGSGRFEFRDKLFEKNASFSTFNLGMKKIGLAF